MTCSPNSIEPSGPVAIMSLQTRGLLPDPGDSIAEVLPARDELLDRVRGALLGAAVGSALGRLSEQKQRRRGAAQAIDARQLARKTLTGDAAKVRSGMQQLMISTQAMLEAGRRRRATRQRPPRPAHPRVASHGPGNRSNSRSAKVRASVVRGGNRLVR